MEKEATTGKTYKVKMNAGYGRGFIGKLTADKERVFVFSYDRGNKSISHVVEKSCIARIVEVRENRKYGNWEEA